MEKKWTKWLKHKSFYKNWFNFFSVLIVPKFQLYIWWLSKEFSRIENKIYEYVYENPLQADANEEAEMIIRAIMQDEVDKSIYSKMADDLETAAKRMKKMKKVKKVKDSVPEIAA